MARKPYYEDDFATIYHGDCLEIMSGMDADVLVTDPPYGMVYNSGWLSRPIKGDHNTIARDAILDLWGNRPALVFGRWNCPHPVKARMMLTWDKGDWPGMGDLALPWGPSTEEIYVLGSGFVGARRGSVLRFDRMGGESHPNQKPLKLMTTLLRACPLGTVLDPFMGSGTTPRAAKDLGRKSIGIEIEERYCEIAARRLAQETFAFHVTSNGA